MFSLICAWKNGWENNGEAGYLRRHRAHYDVTVMFILYTIAKDMYKQPLVSLVFDVLELLSQPRNSCEIFFISNIFSEIRRYIDEDRNKWHAVR